MKKLNKTILGLSAIGAAIAPVAAVISCSGDSTVKSVVTKGEIEKDSGAMALKTKYQGFSKDTIRIIGHKQEVAKQAKASINAFNEAFGTKIVIDEIGGSTNFAQYLSTKFTNANDVGLVQFEQVGEVQAMGNNVVDFEDSFIEANSTQTIGGKKVLKSVSESLGVIYNKDVFKSVGITVHEGEASATATDGLVKNGTNITDVYTDGLTKASYTELANFIKGKGKTAFYSTSKTAAGNIWPYTNHLLSAAIKANDTEAATTGATVITGGVQTSIADALEIYSIGSNIAENTVEEGMGKLATNNVAMSQNGTWALTQIQKTNPKSNVGFLPLPIFGTQTGHEHAQFMKGTTQKWALTTSNDSKQKTMKLFLEWMYKTKTGLKSLYGDFVSETPFGVDSSIKPKIENILFASAANYSLNDVTNGELALSNLPGSFNNDSEVLRNAFKGGFKASSLKSVQEEYDKLKNKPKS